MRHPENKILTEPQPKKAFKAALLHQEGQTFFLNAGQTFKQYLKASFWFPSRHPEDKILTEPQPKKAKLLC